MLRLLSYKLVTDCVRFGLATYIKNVIQFGILVEGAKYVVVVVFVVMSVSHESCAVWKFMNIVRKFSNICARMQFLGM
jgi:hypothetical protein